MPENQSPAPRLPWYQDRNTITALVNLAIIILTAIGSWLGQNAAKDAKLTAESAEVRSSANGKKLEEVHKEVKEVRALSAMGKE